MVGSDEDILAFREWISHHPYLPQYRDDYFLKCMIIASSGSLQQAKVKFENLHRVIQDNPSIFQPHDLLYSEESIRFNKNLAIYLNPEKTKEGYLILSTKYLDTDPTDFSLVQAAKRMLFIAFTIIWDRRFGSGEIVCIFDYEGSKLGHLKTYTSRNVSALLSFTNDIGLFKVKALHYINIPTFGEKILNVSKLALKEKIRKRMHFHSSYKELHDFYSKEILPEDYGGNGPSIRAMHEETLSRLKFHHDKIAAESKNRAEEVKLRPKSEETMTDTFRNLEID